MRELRYENTLKDILEELADIEESDLTHAEKKIIRSARAVLPCNWLKEFDKRYNNTLS